MGNWDSLSPRQRRRRQKAIFRQGLLALCGLLVLAGVGFGIWALTRPALPVEQPPQEEPHVPAVMPELPVIDPAPPQPEPVVGVAADGPDLARLTDQLKSEYAVFIDAETNTVLAEKGGNQLIYPASMTKVLTLLTAAEHIDDPDAPFTMTQEIIDPHYRAGATITGYRSGDVCTLRDLFYGAGLRSSADATTALAMAAAGSEEAFIELMNEKCRELELSEGAHFTNTSGLYHKNHTCTLRDMAAIMRAAMANDLVREVLSTEIYTTAPTEKEPDGLIFQNKYLGWFLEKQPESAAVLACKNGYVAQALNCLVSYGETESGGRYIAVIARAADANAMMGDQRYLYDNFAK